MAARTRAVISGPERLNRLWTDPITKSRLGEDVVLVVEASIDQDIGLDAVEDPESRHPGRDLGDFGGLAPQPFGLEAARIGGRLAVIGDADPVIAGRLDPAREIRHGVRSVGIIGVAVEESAQIAPLEQGGQGRPRRRLRFLPDPRGAQAESRPAREPGRSVSSSGVGTNSLPRQSAAPAQ